MAVGVATNAMNKLLTGDSLTDNLNPVSLNLPCKALIYSFSYKSY
jgi:hypothetical protein